MSYWNSQTFPTTKQRTGVVFFLCAHDTKLASYKFAIKQLLRRGYDVVGYDFDPMVIHSGDPSRLPVLISTLRADIEHKLATDYADGSLEVGLFGSSIGSFISYNILDIPEVNWVILNTGGNLAQGCWRLPEARKAFENQGVTLKELEQAWYELQNPTWHNIQGKRVLILASTGDKLATVADAQIAHEYLLAHKASSRFIRQRKLAHAAVIIYNLTRIGRLLKSLPKNI